MKTEGTRTCPVCGTQFPAAKGFCPVCILREALGEQVKPAESSLEAVSYTHLTLPTICSV